MKNIYENFVVWEKMRVDKILKNIYGKFVLREKIREDEIPKILKNNCGEFCATEKQNSNKIEIFVPREKNAWNSNKTKFIFFKIITGFCNTGR